MIEQPNLTTQRLFLRPFHPADAPDVQRLAGAREIAATTANIPHPYADGMAETWIASHQPALEQDHSVTYAVTLCDGGTLIGAIGLELSLPNRRAELGYWIAVPEWGRGYCTEAAAEMLRYAFEDLALHRVMARHFRGNPASGRVMQKIGMQYEGRMREHFWRWDHPHDIELYGLLRPDWLARAGAVAETGT